MLLSGPVAAVQTTCARTSPAHVHELFVGTWTHTSLFWKWGGSCLLCLNASFGRE